MKTIINYKGIEIEEINGYYIFYYKGVKNINTNLRFAKAMISRSLLNVTRLNQIK